MKQYVRSCTGCQKASRNTHSRAPLQPLPCVGEPFEKVAFDIVGPLPRTISGNRYLLTMMDLFTKYPEAIPLRRVMPFGLRNGPAAFQRMMDQVLSRDQDVSQVYIDDIAVYSTTWEDHCAHISGVLERLKSAGLTANVKKC